MEFHMQERGLEATRGPPVTRRRQPGGSARDVRGKQGARGCEGTGPWGSGQRKDTRRPPARLCRPFSQGEGGVPLGGGSDV